MKVTINGSEYDFRVTGTVGLVYLAERSLGCPYDHTDKYHNLVLYYCAFVSSNKGKDIPDVMEFISCLTTKLLANISQYFWYEWERLEGINVAKEDTQGED